MSDTSKSVSVTFRTEADQLARLDAIAHEAHLGRSDALRIAVELADAVAVGVRLKAVQAVGEVTDEHRRLARKVENDFAALSAALAPKQYAPVVSLN